MHYFKCMKCDYISKQKIDMIRHFNKKINCINNVNINESDIYNESLIKHNIYNELGLNINIKDKNCICNICKKKFHNKSNLNRHINNGKECKLNNILYTNSNILVGFDEEWNTTHLTKDIKQQILMSESKFTTTLKYILNNNQNLNVILKDNSLGIIYKVKNNQYEVRSIKDIIDLTMNKIYKHLIDFFKELINEQNIDENIINSINIRYNIYKKNILTKNDVNNCIYNIFDENKIKSLKKIMEIIK